MATYHFIFNLLFIYYLYNTRIDVMHSFLFYNTQKQKTQLYIMIMSLLIVRDIYKNFSNICWLKKFKNNFLKTVYIHTGLPKFGNRQKIQFFQV